MPTPAERKPFAVEPSVLARTHLPKSNICQCAILSAAIYNHIAVVTRSNAESPGHIPHKAIGGQPGRDIDLSVRQANMGCLRVRCFSPQVLFLLLGQGLSKSQHTITKNFLFSQGVATWVKTGFRYPPWWLPWFRERGVSPRCLVITAAARIEI